MLCNDALKVSIPAGAEIAAGIMEVVDFRFKESDVGRDLLSFSIGIGSLTTLLLLPQSGPVLVLLGEECLRFRAFFETTSSMHVLRKSSSFVEEGGEDSCCLFGRRRLLRGVFVWLVFTLKYANFNFILKRRARLSFGDAGIGREEFLWGCSVAVVIVMLYYYVLLASLLFFPVIQLVPVPVPAVGLGLGPGLGLWCLYPAIDAATSALQSNFRCQFEFGPMRKKENNAFVQHNAMQFKTIADNAGHGTTVTVKTETVSELVFVYIRVLVWVLTNN
jgi:hypothetical protein